MVPLRRSTIWALWVAIGLAGCSPAADPVALMNQGVEILEEYRYAEAFRIFDRLAKEYPGWVAAHVNKGLAALNWQKDDEKHVDYLPIADQAFARALELDPKCIHALVSRGKLYEHTNRPEEKLRDFSAAAELDPQDPNVLFLRAVALMEAGRGDKARADLEKARADLEKVARIQPSFASAYWRLRESFVRTNQKEEMQAAIDEFQRLELAEMGIKDGKKYGEAGKYSLAIRDTVPPGWKAPVPGWKPPAAPAFGPRVVVSQRVAPHRTRPDGKLAAPALAAGDLDGGGVLELVLCGKAAGAGAEGERGKGAGTQAAETAIHGLDAAGAWKQLEALPYDAAACALGDIDQDFDQDLVLAGDGWLRILLNDGKGKLKEMDLKAEGASFAGFPVRLYLLDADSDWDLDIVCLRQDAPAGGRVRSRLEILNNNRDGTFKEIAAQCGIGPFDFPAVELVAADLDGDIDADFVIFDGATGEPRAFANDRVWRYHPVDAGPAAPRAPGLASTAGGDLDGDCDEDLVLFCGDALRFWRNTGGLRFEEDAGFAQRFGKLGGTAGALADFQGALRTSLIVLDAKGFDALGGSGPVFIAGLEAEKPISLSPPLPVQLPGERSVMAVVAGPRRGPELIVYDTASGATSYPVSTPAPASWLLLDLEGPKKPVSKMERSNTAGVGASVEVRAGTRSARFLLHGGAGGAARWPARVFCGLAGASSADYARILWADSVLQAEGNLAPGGIHRVKEVERKPSSCPILFAWTGKDHELVADFLGVGGLGYLELPGVYSRPDPSEYVLLPPLAPKPAENGGAYSLEVLEPLEECTYLDELKLTVADHPEGVTVIPEEMFAVKGPAPGFRLLAFREKLSPIAAWNDAGDDVTREIRDADRRYANRFERDPRFPGLARGTHAIELDFGGAIRGILEKRPPDGRAPRPYLFLHGYVEYGYSTSNFAAWQAKAAFHAPSVRAERGGGWVTLREEWGFPAGYPRTMAVDLCGLLEPGDRRLRVDTNMDIHWDQAFLADAAEEGSLTVTELAADEALLRFAGFPAEERPGGEGPEVYVWRGFERDAGFKTFPGSYTRCGDVRELLAEADDRFAILGPGDALSFSVRADRLPPLAPGRRRTFLAKAFGYCKDMDLYTAHPDRVEPLPFRAMSGYPFRPEEAAPGAAARAAYSREWNTREVR